MTQLKQTPLNLVHKNLNAKMAEFGGWEMPIQYEGIIKEHQAVRERAGLFDVSHMGEFIFAGEDALMALQRLVTNDVSKLKISDVMYTTMLQEDGGIVDDLLIYVFGTNRYLLVVNAANKEKDLAWIENHLTGKAAVADKSDEYALLALQGPASLEILEKLTSQKLAGLKYYTFTLGALKGIPCLISRTGYTGEDGFELYCEPDMAEKLWEAIITTGAEKVSPAGLGARDTLRFEACLSLYGHELTAETNPIMAGLKWTVQLNKEDFIGKEALQKIEAEGCSHQLVGLKMLGRGIPRAGYTVQLEGENIGWVTSGSYAPTLEGNFALAYVDVKNAVIGKELNVVIRNNPVLAKVVKKPFYKRNK